MVGSWLGWRKFSSSGEVSDLGGCSQLGIGTFQCFGSVSEEGTLVIAQRSSGQCGALCRAGADLLEGLQDPKILPPAGEPFLVKAAG